MTDIDLTADELAQLRDLLPGPPPTMDARLAGIEGAAPGQRHLRDFPNGRVLVELEGGGTALLRRPPPRPPMDRDELWRHVHRDDVACRWCGSPCRATERHGPDEPNGRRVGGHHGLGDDWWGDEWGECSACSAPDFAEQLHVLVSAHATDPALCDVDPRDVVNALTELGLAWSQRSTAPDPRVFTRRPWSWLAPIADGVLAEAADRARQRAKGPKVYQCTRCGWCGRADTPGTAAMWGRLGDRPQCLLCSPIPAKEPSPRTRRGLVV